MSPTYESMKPGKQIHIYQNREHFLLFSLDSSSSSSHTASCQICYTISALLQDELLFVKALQHFSAEPVSQQSQALTLLDCDMQWHAVSQPQKTMFDVSLHIWLQATAALTVASPEMCIAPLWGVCIWFCPAPCVSICKAQSSQSQHDVTSPQTITRSIRPSLPELSHSDWSGVQRSCTVLAWLELNYSFWQCGKGQ